MIFRLLLIAVILKQLVWMGFIPMWQFPDEQAHFAQVQNITEGKRGRFVGLNTSKEIVESEKLLGTVRDGAGNNEFTYRPWYNIPYASGVYGIYEQQIKNFVVSDRRNLVIQEATLYPPLYYEIAALFYRAVYGADLITRLFITRFVNLGFYLICVIFAYWTGKLLFPKRPGYSETLAILVAFHPMFSFVSAGVTSDNLFNAVFMGVLFVSIWVMKKRFGLKELFVMSILAILAIWTKPNGQLVPLIYVFPVAVSFWRNRGKSPVRIFGTGLLAVIVGWMGLNMITRMQFVPEISSNNTLLSVFSFHFWEFFRWTMGHTYREVVPWYWGVFRWLSLTYPRYVHRVINWLSVIAVIGLLRVLNRLCKREKVNINFVDLSFLVYVSGVYFLALAVFDFLFKNTYGYTFGIQGRYYFPTLVAHMALILIGITCLFPEKIRHIPIAKIIGTLMVALHTYAQIFVIKSYFNLSSLAQFFLQASQYKPWFFKIPWLPPILVISYISLGFFLWRYLRGYEKR